jgi:hypothetical protein
LTNQQPSEPPSEQPLLKAARADLPRLLSIVLTPLIQSEVRLVSEEAALQERADDAGNSDAGQAVDQQQLAGPVMEALLISAAEQLASDDKLKQRILTQISTDQELLDLLEQELIERFRTLASAHVAAAARPERTRDVLGGGWGGKLREATDRVREFFARAAQAPSRIPSVLALRLTRGALHPVITRFSGDVFEYLLRRGNAQSPGPIVRTVLASIDAALARRPDEPLIVITHSMGGNIFYDILTHYRPNLEAEVWVSVGGQVGLFEEMKLFHESDLSIKTPRKIDQLGRRVRCWLNVYDPADPAAFLAAPVFQNVKDIPFSTGAGDYHTHLNYFKRLRLYASLHSELEGAFTK